MEQVILVDEQDNTVGLMEKMEAHQKGLLHRAFSIFIFNSKGEMLLQQRALDKYHCGGLWTNACCSHPRQHESNAAAAARRLQEELGFETELQEIFSFVYKADFDNGLTEHEYDHVFVGQYEGSIKPNPLEVANIAYRHLANIQAQLQETPEQYTPWFKIAFEKVVAYQQQKSL